MVMKKLMLITEEVMIVTTEEVVVKEMVVDRIEMQTNKKYRTHIIDLMSVKV